MNDASNMEPGLLSSSSEISLFWQSLLLEINTVHNSPQQSVHSSDFNEILRVVALILWWFNWMGSLEKSLTIIVPFVKNIKKNAYSVLGTSIVYCNSSNTLLETVISGSYTIYQTNHESSS